MPSDLMGWAQRHTPPLPPLISLLCLHAYLDTKEDEKEEAKEEEGGGVVAVMVLKEEAAAAPTAREALVAVAAAPAAETTRGKRLLAAVRGKGMTEDQVLAAVRIAAVLHEAARVLETEAVLDG